MQCLAGTVPSMCGGFEIPLFWSELLSLFKSRQNKYIQWEAPKSNGAILCQVKLSQHAAAVKHLFALCIYACVICQELCCFLNFLLVLSTGWITELNQRVKIGRMHEMVEFWKRR